MLQEDDVLSRCIIYDRAFQDDVHVDSLLMRFDSGADDDGIYHESCFLKRLLPRDEDVHQLGCEMAAAQNRRKNEPEPGPKRRYYCGFRNARISDLQLEGPNFSVTLTLDGENGQPAHVDVALKISVAGKSARATVRTLAGMTLAEAFGEASEHICECDAGDQHHPLSRDRDCLRRGLIQLTSIHGIDYKRTLA